MSVITERKPPKADKKEKTRVGRYWPGKVPEYAADADDADEERVVEPTIIVSSAHVEHKADRRLGRLQKPVDREDALRRHREYAEVVSVASPEIKEEEHVQVKQEIKEEVDEEVPMDLDDDDDSRRERARLLYLKRKMEEEEALQREQEQHEEEEGDDEEEEESEYETDSDDDDFPTRPTIQPVFVRKEERETIAERDKIIEEEERLEELRQQQLKERKEDSKKRLKEEVEKEKMLALAPSDEEDKSGSDESEEDEAKEYELWKVRELARIKRDREEKEAVEREREETERRRNMTDAEIRQIDKDKFVKVKKKWKFLQKYYHKGAFFREGGEQDVYNKDFSAPTGEDIIDKTLLPKVMQVKNFGRSGRTKYTHLVDQDTTFAEKDSPWVNSDPLKMKYIQKMGGMHGGLDRPSLKKKKEK
jgi:microfibrillar-associated protein 1